MINIGELSAVGYGVVIFATDLFNKYTKNKKWRAKKYVSFFDKHKEYFHQIIKDGIIFPIYQIARFEYEIFIKLEENNEAIPDGYKEIYRYNDFYIEVGPNNKLCFAGLEYLEYDLDMIKNNIVEESSAIPTGPELIMETYHRSIGLDIEQGKYNFNLIGLKKIKEEERKSKNYGFLFEFYRKENAINDNFIKGDNEKDIFKYDIMHMEHMKIFSAEELKYINPEQFYVIEDFLKLSYGQKKIPYHIHDLKKDAFIGMDEEKRLYKVTGDRKIIPIEETIIDYFSRKAMLPPGR